MIGRWGLLNPGLDLRAGPYGRQRETPVSDLRDAIRRLFQRFGRPSQFDLNEEHDEKVDGRLTVLEQRQREIAARLRILEKQGNPRGIGRG